MVDEALHLIEGRDIIGYLAGARVPMPKTIMSFLDRCSDFRDRTRKYHLSNEEPEKPSLRRQSAHG